MSDQTRSAVRFPRAAATLSALALLLPAPRAARAVESAKVAKAAQPGGADLVVPKPVEAAYVIGPEDVLQVSVWKNDDLSRVVPVRPDGMISLPLLNDVQAAARTPEDLRQQLTRRLAEFIPSPQVSVIVTEVKSFKVSVIGQVMKPGRYELRSRATVVDVLAMAGGFAEFASRSKVAILRRDGQGIRRIAFNYDKVNSDDDSANMAVHPGDVVLVP